MFTRFTDIGQYLNTFIQMMKSLVTYINISMDVTVQIQKLKRLYGRLKNRVFCTHCHFFNLPFFILRSQNDS